MCLHWLCLQNSCLAHWMMDERVLPCIPISWQQDQPGALDEASIHVSCHLSDSQDVAPLVSSSLSSLFSLVLFKWLADYHFDGKVFIIDR